MVPSKFPGACIEGVLKDGGPSGTDAGLAWAAKIWVMTARIWVMVGSAVGGLTPVFGAPAMGSSGSEFPELDGCLAIPSSSSFLSLGSAAS